MTVRERMSKKAVTVVPQDSLAQARAKMDAGGFRMLPVVEGGKLLGVVTDRDIRQHLGHLEKTKVTAAMTEQLVTITPQASLEEAAHLLLEHKIGGLPVLEDEKLIGVITTSDIVKAFLEARAPEAGATPSKADPG